MGTCDIDVETQVPGHEDLPVIVAQLWLPLTVVVRVVGVGEDELPCLFPGRALHSLMERTRLIVIVGGIYCVSSLCQARFWVLCSLDLVTHRSVGAHLMW